LEGIAIPESELQRFLVANNNRNETNRIQEFRIPRKEVRKESIALAFVQGLFRHLEVPIVSSDLGVALVNCIGERDVVALQTINSACIFGAGTTTWQKVLSNRSRLGMARGRFQSTNRILESGNLVPQVAFDALQFVNSGALEIDG
jgi:hypothetical protein